MKFNLLHNTLSRLLLAAIGGVFTIYSQAAVAAEKVRIGIIYPKSGIYASLGPGHLKGVQMAIDDYGKVLGEMPTVIIRDNGTKVEQGVTAATELITSEKVHVLIGAINTPVNNAIAKIADQYKIPFLYPSGGSTFMSGLGKDLPYPGGVVKANVHPYMFYSMVDASDRGAATVDVADLFGKRWYFVAADYEYGRESVGFTKRSLIEKFGDSFKVVGESWPKQGEVDYTSVVTNALAAKADVVYVVLPGRFAQFQKQAAALGLTRVSRIHWAYDEGTSAVAAGDAAFGVTATSTYAYDIPGTTLATDFAKRYHKRYGEWPDIFSVSAYQGTRMMLMAIDKAGSLNGGKIMKATHGLEDPNPVGGPPYHIRACDQHAVQSMYTSEWTKSGQYAPGHWKILKKFANAEAAALPCLTKANYDKMEY